MKSFFISLFVFVLLMCSCRSKGVVTGYSNRLQVDSETAYLNEVAKIDTTKTAYCEQLRENKRIVETIIITEYDAESGKPIKETKATREITQDTDKVVSEEEERGTSEVTNDSLNHFVDILDMVESEVKEESEGGQESFGKWFGIIVGILLSAFFVYLLRKFRVN